MLLDSDKRLIFLDSKLKQIVGVVLKGETESVSGLTQIACLGEELYLITSDYQAGIVEYARISKGEIGTWTKVPATGRRFTIVNNPQRLILIVFEGDHDYHKEIAKAAVIEFDGREWKKLPDLPLLHKVNNVCATIYQDKILAYCYSLEFASKPSMDKIQEMKSLPAQVVADHAWREFDWNQWSDAPQYEEADNQNFRSFLSLKSQLTTLLLFGLPAIVVLIGHLHFLRVKNPRLQIKDREFELASLGRRFVAFSLDMAVTAGPFTIVSFFIISSGMRQMLAQDFPSSHFINAIGISTLLSVGAVTAPLIYFFYFEWKKGATPGKMLLGLRVIMEDGSPLSFQGAVLRTAFRVVDSATYYLTVISGIAASPTYQRLGDMAAKSLVIRESGTRQLETGETFEEPVPPSDEAGEDLRKVNRRLAITYGIAGTALCGLGWGIYILTFGFVFSSLSVASVFLLLFVVFIILSMVLGFVLSAHYKFMEIKPTKVMIVGEEMILASLGHRVIAQILDIIFIVVPMMVVSFLFMRFIGPSLMTSVMGSKLGGTALMLLVLIMNVTWPFLYFFYCEWKGGETPGKYFMGIKVVMENGGPITPLAVMQRTLMRIVDQSYCLPGIASMAATRKYQRLGDLAGGTVVVLVPAELSDEPKLEKDEASGQPPMPS